MTELRNGDCLAELSNYDEGEVDLIATDPPYGLSFMGKDWDKAVPSVEIWKECLRVLKPGAFAFIMSSPRLDVLSQMALRLSEGGFNTGFTPIYWAYASGFPKATNISKAVDKKLGFERQKAGRGPYFSEGRERTFGDGNKYGKAEGGDSETDWVTRPASFEAKALDGSYAGFQPKPAVEVIIVCMKPLSEKTYVDQALKNAKGITWLDEARIPFEEDPEDLNRPVHSIGGKNTYAQDSWTTNPENWQATFGNEKGRFPANLLVSDDVLNDGQVTVSSGGSGSMTTGSRLSFGGEDIKSLKNTQDLDGLGGYGDSGSFSRYFSLDAWFDKKLEELPKEIRKTFPFLIEPKASKGERNEGLDGFPAKSTGHSTADTCKKCGKCIIGTKGSFCKCEAPERQFVKSKNSHPTVKPISIMSYLITLGSRIGETVLDPFMGSGTTGIAAKMLQRKFIGIEIDPESFKIAEARIKAEVQIILPSEES